MIITGVSCFKSSVFKVFFSLLPNPELLKQNLRTSLSFSWNSLRLDIWNCNILGMEIHHGFWEQRRMVQLFCCFFPKETIYPSCESSVGDVPIDSEIQKNTFLGLATCTNIEKHLYLREPHHRLVQHGDRFQKQGLIPQTGLSNVYKLSLLLLYILGPNGLGSRFHSMFVKWVQNVHVYM